MGSPRGGKGMDAVGRGETWRIRHVRKGVLVVKLNEDITTGTEFFSCTIVKGRPRMFRGGRPAGPGDTITLGRPLVRFIARVIV